VSAAIGAIARGAERAFPGALTGNLLAAVALLLLGFFWFRTLRTSRPLTSDR
jgi:hypothetical protein